MRIPNLFSSNLAFTVGGAIAIALIAWLFAYEPVTRTFVAAEPVCAYCHLEREYSPSARLSFSTAHPVELKEGEFEARCVDCHLPEGFWPATYAYTHYLSATDLFGHFRDRASERAGAWIPQSAARAYRVRDRLLEYDSSTCRSCHIEEEIKPKRKRGQKAHAKALEEKQTCSECHYNLVHREVDIRDIEVETAKTSGEN
jgi:nitrate/TMAO reductase-like tetraheme cytochrome c subunit